MHNEISQRAGLEILCDTAKEGELLEKFLSHAGETNYKMRTGGPDGKDEKDWFDREYLRLGIWLEKTRQISGDYTVIFAKPGMGYYACIIIHQNNLITSAWFEDKSS